MVRTAFTISPLSILSKAVFHSRRGKRPPTRGATSRAPEPRSAITRSQTGQLWLKLPCSRTAFWTIDGRFSRQLPPTAVGQSKVVSVYRLIAKGTVEEKILQLKQRKKDLVNSVLSEDQTGEKLLSREDLDDLFRTD